MGTAACSVEGAAKVLPLKCLDVEKGKKDADEDHDPDIRKGSKVDAQKSAEDDKEEAQRRRRSSVAVTGYLGEWVDERKHGKGSFTYENGDTYVGEWVKDKAHGHGIYKTKFSIYTGEWSEDLKNGHGEESYHDEAGETLYKGDFHQGHRHGRGSLTWPDGSTYDGDFCQNNLQGMGVFVFKNGQKYSGAVADNSIDGAGRYEWPDGTHYEGQYKVGMKHGHGSFLLKSGFSMKCEWRDGKQYGPVTFKAKELAPPNLDWYDGVMVSWATRSEDGDATAAGEATKSSASVLFSGRGRSGATGSKPSSREQSPG